MTDIAWAAGFLEGEGSFIHSKPARTTPGGQTYVCCTQVQREPLERLQKLFGGAIYDYKKPRKANWSPQSLWKASGARGAAIMMTIYSFMSPKRKVQIETALTAWKTAAFPKGTKDKGYRMIDPLDAVILEERRLNPSASIAGLSRKHHVTEPRVRRLLYPERYAC